VTWLSFDSSRVAWPVLSVTASHGLGVPFRERRHESPQGYFFESVSAGAESIRQKQTMYLTARHPVF